MYGVDLKKYSEDPGRWVTFLEVNLDGSVVHSIYKNIIDVCGGRTLAESRFGKGNFSFPLSYNF